MSTDLFIPIKFRTNIQLNPKEISANFEEVILKKLKNNLENICSRHGYIKKDSINIIKRSIGQFKKQHFNGNIMFELQCIAEICNPAQGSIIKCKVKAKNSLGLLAEGYYDNVPILEIIVPKISAGIQSEINIDTVLVGDEINIEVCGKKYQLYDKHISIIGKAIKDKEENIKNVIEDELEEDRIDETSTVIIDDDLLVLDDEEEENDEIDDDEISISAKKKLPDDDEEEEEEDIDNFEENEVFDDIEFEGGDEEIDFD